MKKFLFKLASSGARLLMLKVKLKISSHCFSWGLGCGGGVPGVYVDVARYNQWIVNNVIRETLRF